MNNELTRITRIWPGCSCLSIRVIRAIRCFYFLWSHGLTSLLLSASAVQRGLRPQPNQSAADFADCRRFRTGTGRGKPSRHGFTRMDTVPSTLLAFFASLRENRFSVAAEGLAGRIGGIGGRHRFGLRRKAAMGARGHPARKGFWQRDLPLSGQYFSETPVFP